MARLKNSADSKLCTITNVSSTDSPVLNQTPSVLNISSLQDGDPSKNCTINNNDATASLVLDAYNTTSTNPKQVYGQTLTALALQSGGNILNGSSSGTVTLNDYSVDSKGNKIYNTVYELIIARATDLFPVANNSVMQSFSNPPTYPAVTVVNSSSSNMQLAYQFCQTLMAYPTSTLSQQFQTAMNSALSATSTGSIDKTMNAFFASTKQYQNVTFNMYMAVSTYLTYFANAWANFASTYTYYLYSSGSASSGSNSANPKFIGSLTMTQKPNPNGQANPSDNNGGYDIAFVDSNNNSTVLNYSNGQFVSSLTEDVPSICLQCTYVLKSQLSNNASDNQIIPIMSGMVNGSKVMGVDTKQDNPDDPGSLYSFFHPTTFQGWLSLFMGVFGVLMALEWAGSKLAALGKGIAKLFSKDGGAPPSNTEMDDLRAQVEDLQTQMQANQQELLDRFNEQAQLPNNVDEAMADLKVEFTNQYNTINADVQMDILNEQALQIQELAEYGVTPEMEEVANSIRENMNALNNATTPEELQTALDSVKASIPDINTKLGNMVEEMSEEISAETKAAIQESIDNINDYQELSDEIDDSIDDLNDGEIPDIDPIE